MASPKLRSTRSTLVSASPARPRAASLALPRRQGVRREELGRSRGAPRRGRGGPPWRARRTPSACCLLGLEGRARGNGRPGSRRRNGSRLRLAGPGPAEQVERLGVAARAEARDRVVEAPLVDERPRLGQGVAASGPRARRAGSAGAESRSSAPAASASRPGLTARAPPRLRPAGASRSRGWRDRPPSSSGRRAAGSAAGSPRRRRAAPGRRRAPPRTPGSRSFR